MVPALESDAGLQVHVRAKLAEARNALAAGAFDAVLFVAGHDASELPEELASAARLDRRLALLVALPEGSPAAEQSRLLGCGADLVLLQPLDAAVLRSVLRRLTSRGATPLPVPAPAVPSESPATQAGVLAPAMEVLRDFSQVLGYSLDSRQLAQHFLLKLREFIGVSRLTVFLESGATDALTGQAMGEEATLPCAAAIGLPADLAACFALSRASGIGGLLTAQPQILRAPAATMPPMADPQVAREFEVLGGIVAIPVNDRERTIGIAVLGARLTGGGYSDQELLLVHHLLEQLGLAVRNCWMHRQLAGGHQLFSRVLEGITVGAVVVGPGFRILYANQASLRLLAGPGAAALDESALPAPLAERLHSVIERGAAVDPFYHDHAGRALRASIVPLLRDGDRRPQTALLLLEDFTQIQAAQRAEIDASNLKLIGLIARRFAHEIRNSLVPLTTHQQLFDAEIEQPEFRESLKAALARETRRIQRFTDQMLLLARADTPPTDLVPLNEVLQAAFQRSREFTGGVGELALQGENPPVLLRCNRASLLHAFQEIFLNGLQSAGDPPQLSVSLAPAPAADGGGEIEIRIRDGGAGFAADSAPRATEPFFTTRNTGVGLGLTIARRVIEAHHGRLEVKPRANPADPDLVIHLPIPR